jgi:dephospho-CoA kinase
MTRIAFCGRMGSGKTTACKYLVEQSKVLNKTSTILSFAQPLKELAYQLFGYENKSQVFNFGGRTITARELLQELGNKMREINPNIWRDLLEKKIKENFQTENIFIDDLRFNNEEEMLIKNNFKIVSLVSTEEDRMKRMFLRDGVYPEKELLHKCGEDTIFKKSVCLIRNQGIDDYTLEEFYNQLDIFFNDIHNKYTVL